MTSPVSTESKGQHTSRMPRAVIHKQILEVAKSEPDASMEKIADEIAGATPDLVERVLAEYGDPVDTDQPEETQNPGKYQVGDVPAEKTECDDLPSYDQLTAKQQEIIKIIWDHPGATQRELADMLDVTEPTVNVHANSIPGFEWKHRQRQIAELLEDGEMSQKNAQNGGSTGTDPDIEAIEGRIDELEREVGEATKNGIHPELGRKIVHTCMASDQFTKEEELMVISHVF